MRLRSDRAARRICLPLLMAICALACSDAPPIPTRSEVQAHIEGGRLEEAIEALGVLIPENPDDFELQLLYGRTLISAGSLSRAVFPLSRAIESPDHAVEAGIALAGVQIRIQDGADALKSTQRVLEIDPGNVSAMSIRAEAYLQLKGEGEALEQLDEALEADPTNINLFQMKFRALIALERIDEAAAVLDELAEIASDEERGHPAVAAQFCVGSAVFAKERGELEEAELKFQQCLEATPDALENQLLVREAARFYDERGDFVRATQLWQDMFDLDPENLTARANLANRLRAVGRKDEAVTLLREATEQYPSTWLALVDIYVEDEDFAKAIEAMQGAIESHPDPNALWIFSLADFQIVVGDLEAAESTLERLEEPVHRLFIEARLLYSRGRYVEAYEKFLEAVRLWPDNSSYRYLAGLAADRAGQYEAALDQYKEAARMDPPPFEATLAFADLMVAQGQYGAAFHALSRLLKANPTDARIFIALAEANARSKEGDGGQAALKMLSKVPGQARLAVSKLISFANRSGGPDAAVRAADRSKLDLTHPSNFLVLSNLTRILVANGRVEAAIERTGIAVAAHPDSAVLLALHGEVLADADQIESALSMTARARAQSPDDFEVLLCSARVARASGQTDEAVSWAVAALALEPSRREPLIELANIEAAAGNSSSALRRLSRALDEAPHDGELAKSYATILFESGTASPSELRIAGRRARLFGGDQASNLLFGRILLAIGEAEASITLLERATQQAGPEVARATYYLGIGEAEAGRREDAARHLKEALELGSFSEQQDARERLRSFEAQAS